MISSLPARLSAVVMLLLADTGSAWAHTGEHSGGLAATLQHMFGNFDHLSLLLAAVGAAGVLGIALRSVRRHS